MKSKQEKRREAFKRLKESKYINSKASRVGNPEEMWEAEKQKRIDNFGYVENS